MSGSHYDDIERLAREVPKAIERQWERKSTEPADAELELDRLGELERLAYRRAAQLGHEIPWPVLRRRLQDWPYHLENELLAWFASSDVSPRRQVWLHRGNDPDFLLDLVERRRQGIGVFLAEIAEANVPRELDDDRYLSWRRDLRVQRARGPLRVVVKRLADGEDWFDKVVGALWEILPYGSIEANELLDAMEEAGRIARQVPVSAMLARLDGDETELRATWTRHVRWCDSHQDEWHELASHGRGRERFLALQWCAQRDGKPLGEVFAVPMGQGDSELDTLLLTWWRDERRTDLELELLPPQCLVTPREMPLRYQARWDVPGWRYLLLERLSQTDTVAYCRALVLAADHPVPEALPLLIAQLNADWETYEPSEEVRAKFFF